MTIPQQYKFCYRVLASVDIVGSTAFKSGQARVHQSWAHIFRNFFEEFPSRLAQSFKEIQDDATNPCKPPREMGIWKFVGDEILFFADIGRHEQVAFHVLSLKHAVNQYAKELSTKYKALGLKGTVWGAGFPCANVEVQTKIDRDSPNARDFLGESVDLGFRLAGYADARRIPLSPEVAWFLLHFREKMPKGTEAIHIFAEPPQMLKGIRGGQKHPILWLDRLDGKPSREDRMLGIQRAYDAGILKDYLEDHFDTDNGGLGRPFVESDPDKFFNAVPEAFVKWRDQLVKEDADLGYERSLKPRDLKKGSSKVAPPPRPPPPKNEIDISSKPKSLPRSRPMAGEAVSSRLKARKGSGKGKRVRKNR